MLSKMGVGNDDDESAPKFLHARESSVAYALFATVLCVHDSM
jgi:hypothetical protein